MFDNEEKVKAVCVDHSDPPTMQQKVEVAEARAKYPQLRWYNQQLYQVLALNCKGEALGTIKALAAAEYRCDSLVSSDSRSQWIQRATNSGIGGKSFSTSTLSEDVGQPKPS